MFKLFEWFCLLCGAASVICMSCVMTVHQTWADEWWMLIPGVCTLVLFKWAADGYEYAQEKRIRAAKRRQVR